MAGHPLRRAALAVTSLALLGVGLVPSGASAADAACAAPANEVVAENCLPGSPPSQWDIKGIGDRKLQGFATDMSVNRGTAVTFKVKTDSRNYRLDIYRLGYYGGLGARKVATVQPSARLPQRQPACATEPASGLIDCGTWQASASWRVPATAVSGVYIAKLVREDPADGRASHIPFIVRDDSSDSDVLFQTSDTTWQAYNDAGGNSLYKGEPAGRAYKVSYNRPFLTRGQEGGEDYLFNAEYPMIRFLEANGYDVSYFSGVDTDRLGGLLTQHETFLSVGHDEYWSGPQRANVEAARDAGVNLAFLSGNEMFWKTRWETSIAPGGQPYRTLVSYKETLANAPIDPADPPVWTGTWRDPRFSPPADGGRPENALTGTAFTVNCCTYAITVPAADGRLRLWRNTSVASLPPSGTATLSAGTLGYEWDEDLDNGFRPAGLVRMSTTTVDVPQKLQDYGSTYGPGTATHSLTLYRASSGALVFGAGTVQWTWGLDATHDRSGSPADKRIRQATVNLLADMEAQPGSLQTDLVRATASADTAPATAAITAPAPGDTTPEVGVPLTVRGTAADVGGVVGGVEVSVDGGTSWHPATGRQVWAYEWTPSTAGPTTLLARAADDSANLGASSAAVQVTVGDRECPCTIFPSTATPASPAESDGQPIEAGVKFEVATAGQVTDLRFYKGAANTGTHVGNLWTADGQLLASATYTGETASGWQRVQLGSPVDVVPGTTYVVSYFSPTGYYASTGSYFDQPVDAAPLRAPANGEEGPNGVYAYGGGFPSSGFQATNYWADVVFVPAP